VKIDTERMVGGQELLNSYPRSKNAGIPWFVFLEPDGKELADSVGPNGNIGCPNTGPEIDAFLEIVKKVAVTLTADDLSALHTSLVAFRKK
jgi:hypothetical protein